MIANAQQARQLVKNSKHYRLEIFLQRIENHAKSGALRYTESAPMTAEEKDALRARGFVLSVPEALARSPRADYTIISWEEAA